MSLYSKCGVLGYARALFDRMPEKNLISWSSMVSMYAKRGFSEDAVLVFLEFRRCCNESPSEHILASVIRAFRGMGGGGEQVHGLAMKVGFNRDVYVGTSLVDFYAKTGNIDTARMVFYGLSEKSTFSWTTIITGYVKCGRGEVSLRLFHQMRETDVVCDKYVLCSILSACSMLDFVEGGKQIHCHVLRREAEMDSSVVNALIDLYTKCGKVKSARKLFDQMVDRDVISWSALIAGYMQNSFHVEAVELFVEMTGLDFKPDGFTCTSILTSCGSLEALEQGRQVHAYSIKAYLEFDVFVQNSLIYMYAKCGSLTYARRVFDIMTNHNVVSYNALIEGYSTHERFLEALSLFREMRLRMLRPSLLTFISLLGVTAALSALELCKQIHALAMKFGVSLEVFMGSALIDAYSKCASTMDARLVFDAIIEKDIVVWNAMLSCYTQQSQHEEAFKLFSELQLSEQKPNGFTFAALVTAASDLPTLQHGKQLHNQIIKNGLCFDPFITNSLVDLYAKCGSLEDAHKAFTFAIRRDAICYNSIILTHAYHGKAIEALQMFERMVQVGVKPNYATFVGVLSACSHAGLLEEGLHHFKSMHRFGLEPGIEHYACLVSLLGRAGKLHEAKELIEKTPMMKAAAVWRALLSACRTWGNVELGKYAAEMAISTDPTDSGSYILLSNIYASKGMWADVKQVRQRMDFARVTKESGYSWIEVNNGIHLFQAKDTTHCQSPHIFSVLDNLILQLRRVDLKLENYK